MERSFDFGALLRNHERKHKEKPAQFGSVAGGVKKRLESNLNCRKSTRLSHFDKLRNLPTSDSQFRVNNALSKMENRKMQLEKWKKEKEEKRKAASLHKIKPFIAGVPHNSHKFEAPPPPLRPMPSTSGRVTRSQSASNKNNSNMINSKTVNISTRNHYKSFAPKNATFSAPVLNNLNITSCILKVPSQKTAEKNSTVQSLPKKEIKTSKSKPVVQYEPKNLRSRNKPEANNTKVKGEKPTGTTKLTLSNSSTSKADAENIPPVKAKTPRKRNKNKTMVTPDNKNSNLRNETAEQLQSLKLCDLPMTPEQITEAAKKISPCVTLSRGKDNARKEMKKKITEGLFDEDLCEKDSVEHFRRQLNSEIKRMTEMCETWDKISEQTELPEAIQEAILSAVGQSRLLMSQKLQQFATLLARCERPAPGQALVTPADLHGFWDMVFMQVENVDMRFKKLEEMQACGWKEDQPEEIKKRVPSKPVVRRKPAATSRMKDIIAAARKAKKEQQPAENSEPPPEETKTFDAGFFCVQSPVKSPSVLSTPSRKPSLLKTVLSSEAKIASASKSAASYAMLRASLINKNIENGDTSCEDTVSLPPVDLEATPGLSILKSTNGKKEKRGKKSIKVVLFDVLDTDSLETEKITEH